LHLQEGVGKTTVNMCKNLPQGMLRTLLQIEYRKKIFSNAESFAMMSIQAAILLLSTGQKLSIIFVTLQ
jgi:hypothetical protein